jgi:hypothetical protein
MWQTFVAWFMSLFGKKIAEDAVEQTFNGWIKDEPDARDQIFTGEK